MRPLESRYVSHDTPRGTGLLTPFPARLSLREILFAWFEDEIEIEDERSAAAAGEARAAALLSHSTG